MKSMKTMFAEARAAAISKGPRMWKGTRYGYYLTVGELKGLYMNEGFNHRGTAMHRHLDCWQETDMAAVEGPAYAESSAVWFECPEGSETLVMVLSQSCGGRYVTRIDRTQWPSLRKMHGIQEALP